MASAAGPAIVAVISRRLSFAKKVGGRRLPHLDASASVLALGSIIGVPLLVAFFPRWAGRVMMPLFVVTSVGVYLTVPDTENVRLVMALVVIAAIVAFAATVPLPQVGGAVIAFVIMGAAIIDSGGRGAAIVRAAGCGGALLAAPVAGWLNELRTNDAPERRPAMAVLVVVHCVVVGWASRALIRETSIGRVLVAVGGALFIAVVVLFATARPVAVEP